MSRTVNASTHSLAHATAVATMRAVFERQLAGATRPDGSIDREQLSVSVSRFYARSLAERRGAGAMPASGQEEAVLRRRLLEIDLQQAADGQEFELHYQAQIDVSTRRVRGFEALLRWDHPIRGNVPPSSFIPVAEELGLIGQIGQWVLDQACKDAMNWPEHVGVAVNVSALQLADDSLPDIVAQALRSSGLRPSRLELEITESCMMHNPGQAFATLGRLRATGVRIAMDDFGTGYSSLSHLPDLSFDKIKIDRSFVAKLGQGPAHTAIIRAIITLCACLGAVCTAEGVETEEQLDLLTSAGCAEVQGFLLDRPRPTRELFTQSAA